MGRPYEAVGDPFEVLEHTADVGLRSYGESCEAAFAGVGQGVAVLQGAWFPQERPSGERPVDVEGSDREALLVAWVDELVYLLESEDVVLTSIEVTRVDEARLEALVGVAPRGGRRLEAVGIKAATYHRLRLEQEPDGTWVAEVYVDV